ncbi:hypothetical protein RB653_005715 [Dictyostelium firmibasis]|uniref:Thioredoxin reductase n=1 Tax=Dictyostelium firmibasis TaxID=79012 RepID=A0AAN7U7R4_9MYCE
MFQRKLINNLLSSKSLFYKTTQYTITNNIFIRNMSTDKIEKVVIIGSGPAGHTAGIYAGRARLEPLMFEGFMAAGVAAGGQLTTTTEIENFPGFPTDISGTELMDKMREQNIKCGTTIETKTISKIDLQQRPFTIYVEDEEDKPIKAQSIIIATGATAKRMGVPGETQFWSKGVSACAVCDGALPIYRNKHLVVVGGGDTAAEEATFLTHFASKVTLLVRRNAMRASKAMQQKVFTNPKIEVLWDTILVEIKGDTGVTSVGIQNVKNNITSDLPAQGLFYAIGHTPNSAFLDGQIKTDETGYIITQPGTTKTNVEGVFACGDVQDKVYRQAITAAGNGCMAALDCERFLSSL